MWKLTCDHDGLGVAAEAVLEQPREHRVAVRDEDAAARTHRALRHVSCDATGTRSNQRITIMTTCSVGVDVCAITTNIDNSCEMSKSCTAYRAWR